MKPYKLTVLRIMPDPAIAEFLNVGVVFLAGERLEFRVTKSARRLAEAFPDAPKSWLEDAIETLKLRAHIAKNGFRKTPIPFEDAVESIAPRGGGGIRRSETMGGITRDLDAAFDRLYDEYVGRREKRVASRARVDEKALEKQILEVLMMAKVPVRHNARISAPHYSHNFTASWQNGMLNVLDGISFDYLEEKSVIEKAVTWAGRLGELRKAQDFKLTAVVSRPLALPHAFDDAMSILNDQGDVEIVPSEDFPVYASVVIRQSVAHVEA